MSLRIFIFVALLTLPFLAEAATAPKTFKELAYEIIRVSGYGVAILVTLTIVLYMWGLASNTMKITSGEISAFKPYLGWGLAIIFVMVSIWGILNILKSTFFPGEGPGGPGRAMLFEHADTA